MTGRFIAALFAALLLASPAAARADGPTAEVKHPSTCRLPVLFGELR
ncbi:hypothetical protein MYCO108962_17735 [Mycobacterium colombiense]